MSHELRTPLTSIRAFSEILLANPEMESAQREEFLRIVVKESERLTRLVEEVLDLAKIESGRMEWRHEVVDLRQLITDSLAAVSQLLKERGITLEPTLPDEAVSVEVDSDRVVQLLVNLLSNAIKFCDPKAGRVEVRLSLVDECYRIEVEDNGSGIPLDEAERIFEKFHQAGSANIGESLGTGLGLAISRHIAEHHGGRLYVARTGPEGSVFALDLPHRTPFDDGCNPETQHDPDTLERTR